MLVMLRLSLLSCIGVLFAAASVPSIRHIKADDQGREKSFADLEASWKAEYYEEDYDVSGENSCASIMDCRNCSATYTCHWCSKDDACHARGSIYGCNWGSSCSNNDDGDKGKDEKGNSTCASQQTCSDCSLSSHFCHWCEHDNACHARGSIYGCTSGVDCYSNDRCRRPEPEKNDKLPISEISVSQLILVISLAIVLVYFSSFCHMCVARSNNGAYVNLMTISSAARPSRATSPDSPAESEPLNSDRSEGSRPADTMTPDSAPDDEEANPRTQEIEQRQPYDRQQQRLQNEEGTNNDVLMDEDAQNGESSTLLSPGLDAAISTAHHQHSEFLYKLCAFLYYISVTLVLVLLIIVIIFFPKKPVYNVCNDAVAWKNIIEKIARFQVDLGFEILISVSNPNRVDVALDNATGSFTFEGRPVGTFVIPPDNVGSMSITDVMLITHVTPDKYQAIKMADAYWNQNLILTAEFDATLRVPFLMNYTRTVLVENINVYVNELSDRSLCKCPSWVDEKNLTNSYIINLF